MPRLKAPKTSPPHTSGDVTHSGLKARVVPQTTRWAPHAVASCFVAILMAYACHSGLAATELEPETGEVRSFLIGPTKLHGGTLALERGNGKVSQLRITTSGAVDDADLNATLAFFDRVLSRRQPVVIVWDLRVTAWPRMSASNLATIRSFVEAHLILWDTHVQAHAVILTSSIVRGIVVLLLRLFRPPQPHWVGKDLAGALDFLRHCCARPRSFVKHSYE